MGDCHGSALVSRTGSVDWCCLERLDAEPVFCRLLDANRGGFLSVEPLCEFSSHRAYLDGTNILRTTFSTDGGIVAVTDFMPVGRRSGAGVHDYVNLNAPSWLIRVIHCEQGKVPLRVQYRPSIQFGRQPAFLHAGAGHIEVDSGPVLYHDLPEVDIQGGLATAIIELEAGQRHILIVAPQRIEGRCPVEYAERFLGITRAFWEEWIAYCRYKGPYQGAVQRSALALKLLAFAPTGAIAAALTTSLPEEIGGVRNWDYRYCWLRDATLTLYALATLGYGGEANRFSEYLHSVCAATYPNLQIMYGIGGEANLPEETLDHLEGYRGSRPVRTGNGAYRQCQIDVYGEVLDWALLFHTLGGRFNRGARQMLSSIADFVADHWCEPDQGLWEMRGAPRHHVHGKIMSWVALDRAIRLLGSKPLWEKEKLRILEDVQTHGIDPSGGHLLQAYGCTGTDAALLLAPVVAFPLDQATLEATVTKIERELGQGDFIYRYKDADGLEGGEGAFLICSFWLVNALLRVGRYGDAKALFERLLAHANDVGLYAEEIDPNTGDFLGNFPQAFTHLALIRAATQLELYAQQGPAAMNGSHADRATRTVGAILGWRGLWAAFKATRRVSRIRSSNASILPDFLASSARRS